MKILVRVICKNEDKLTIEYMMIEDTTSIKDVKQLVKKEKLGEPIRIEIL